MRTVDSCMLPERVGRILTVYVNRLVHAYGEHLRKILLFGSYARGDYGDESDIDIMILVDYPREMAYEHKKELLDITFEINYNDEVEINPVIQNEAFFNKWIASYPFYNNVSSEGVELYAA